MLSPQARQKIAIMLKEKAAHGMGPSSTMMKPANNMSAPVGMTPPVATSPLSNPMAPTSLGIGKSNIPGIPGTSPIPKPMGGAPHMGGRFTGIKQKLRGL